jgi:glyoxylate utilization-related uncharacterized protein
MNTTASLPPPDTPWILSKPVLDEAGFTGALHLLAPGAEHVPDHAAPGETILFVVAGSVTACIERANHVLQPETTLRVAAGRLCTLRNPTAAPAKVLVLTAPPQPARNPSHLVTLRG